MAEVQIGTLKPEYLQKAAHLRAKGSDSYTASKKAAAMANHPSVRGTSRSAEFRAQADQHLGAAKEARSANRALPVKKTGSFQANDSHAAMRKNAKNN
jgi:hypothetical protein